MEKVKEYINKYKLIVPTITMLLLALVLFFFLKIYNYNIYRDKENISGYKMVMGDKVDFNLTLYKNRLGVIKEVEDKSHNINYDSNPIYLKNKVLFLNNMIVVFPFKNYDCYKIDKYFYFSNNKEINYLHYDGYKYEYYNYFIYDGDDLYFFIDNINLMVGSNTYELSSMSYVKLTGSTLTYYNKEQEKSEVFEINEKDSVKVVNEYIDIDIRNDKAESKMLPNSINNLLNINTVNYESRQ